jgi:hypothetical protein
VSGASGNIDIAATPQERGRIYTLGDFLDVWCLPTICWSAPGLRRGT